MSISLRLHLWLAVAVAYLSCLLRIRPWMILALACFAFWHLVLGYLRVSEDLTWVLGWQNVALGAVAMALAYWLLRRHWLDRSL